VSAVTPTPTGGLQPLAPTLPSAGPYAPPIPAAAQPIGKAKGDKANGDKPWYKKEFYIGRAVKPAIVMNFSRQLASFLGAGIPILEALAIVEEEMVSEKMREVIGDMRAALHRGDSVGAAIAMHPKVFPGYYIAMVRSAELTGRLDEVLDQLADYLERDVEARRQVKSALTYPIVVLNMAIIAVVVMSVWVLPKFQSLYSGLGANLPFPTRVMMGFTDFMTSYWLVVVGALVAAALVVFAIIGGTHGKSRRDRVFLKVPVFGSLLHVIAVERFCRILSALATAGVPLPEAVRVSADSTNNRVFQAKLGEARDAMIRGAGLAKPIADSGMFPAAARQMIRVGESTGTLDAQLATAAEFYERELTYRLKKATDLFEPMVILIVGVVVGFVAVAQISAMYSVFNQIKS
jgi:type IV pilus assembly protein PilC